MSGASSTSSVVSKDKSSECPICLEDFKNPKLLTCMHTFCEQCLCSITKGLEIECPTCRYPTKLTTGQWGLCSLHSLSSDRIAEVRIAEGNMEKSIKDGLAYCSECETEKATKFCSNCRLKLCDICSTYHTRIARQRNHKIIDINKVPPSDLKDKVVHRCEKHNEVLKYYCSTCNVQLCLDCTLSTAHTSHQFNLSSEIVVAKVNALKEVIQKGKVLAQHVEKELSNANTIIQAAGTTHANSVKTVEECFETIFASLRNAKEEILSWLVTGTKTSLDSISNATREFTVLKNSIEYGSKLADLQGADDMISPMLDVTKKIEAFLQSPTNMQQPCHSFPKQNRHRSPMNYNPLGGFNSTVPNSHCYPADEFSSTIPENMFKINVTSREIRKNTNSTFENMRILEEIYLLKDSKNLNAIRENLSIAEEELPFGGQHQYAAQEKSYPYPRCYGPPVYSNHNTNQCPLLFYETTYN